MKSISAQHGRLHIPAIVAAACLLASIARTSAVTLDFEGIPAMPNAGPMPVPVQAQLFNQYLSTFGVSFTSGSSYVSVVNLGFGHAVSGTNGIGGSTPDGLLTFDRAFPIVATFFDPANPSTPAVTDFVSLRIDLIANSGTNVTLKAFDVNGLLIGSFTTADVGGATLQIAAPGIHSVEYIGTTMKTGAAVDNFMFNPLVAVPDSYISWANDPLKGNIPGEPPSGDFDKDGITNLMEYALGMNPRVSSRPAGTLSGNTITFTKGADAITNGDVSWIIETSETLAAGSWSEAVTQAAGNPSPTICFHFTPSTPPRNFARLKVIQTTP